MHHEDATEADVRGYFQSLSNWNRWGPDDELGTLNLITPLKRVEAAAEVREGISVGCARTIESEPGASDVVYPPIHHMLVSGEAESSTSASDFFGIAPHGGTVSHIDTLSHQFWNGQMYNGRSQKLITTAEGATVGSVETMKDGIVTRGVLLDFPRLKGKAFLEPGEAILVEDLEAAERAQGVQVMEGDALLIRTGWSWRRVDQGPYAQRQHRPGLHASTLPWLRERGVAVAGADAAMEVVPSGFENLRRPFHNIGIVAMGLCLVDACQFEDLSAVCERLGRWSFMCVIAPLRWRHGTASPVTPVAVF
jgi:kynurenine formamidase